MKIPIIDSYETGMNIKRICFEKGLTARQLQEFTGMSSVQACYGWWKGKIPTVDNLLILEKVFDMPISEIIVTKDVEISDVDNKKER